MTTPAVLSDPHLKLLAQTSQEIVDATRLSENERLRGGGRDSSSDFTWYVLVPMAVLFCVIVLGRRMMS